MKWLLLLTILSGYSGSSTVAAIVDYPNYAELGGLSGSFGFGPRAVAVWLFPGDQPRQGRSH